MAETVETAGTLSKLRNAKLPRLMLYVILEKAAMAEKAADLILQHG